MVSSYGFRVSPDALGFYSLEESVVVKEKFLPLAKIKISPLLKRGGQGRFVSEDRVISRGRERRF